MGSLRASLAKSALDRTVATEVETARRALDRAIAACRQAGRDPSHPSGRVSRVSRDLVRARGALGRVAAVTPGYDPLDLDFMDEDTRAERRRAEWAERDKTKEEARKTAEANQRAVEAAAIEEGD